MKTAAIICEYNPLHNGHKYHIEETRKAGITHLIALLSDDFVQRGDTALINKFDRAELAIQAGADLVIELPVPYSCASAECYARGAIQLLRDMDCVDELSFGCSGELENLQELAELLPEIENSSRVQELLKSGKSYPSAIAQTVSTEHPEYSGLLSDPNNLLALEYLRAIRNQKADIQPSAVRRETILHDSEETSGAFASASLIRQKFFDHEDYENYIPDFTAERLKKSGTAEFSRLESVILYQMRRITAEELLLLPDVTPELAGRFRKAQSANSLAEFLTAVKSKNFTMARIRRIILYALMGIRKADLHTEIPYARILAFNRRGTELLKQIQFPVGTSLTKLRELSPEAERFVQMEIHTANLYGLAQNQITSAEQEFRRKIKIYQK